MASKADLAVLKAELLLEIDRVETKIISVKSESRIYFVILLSAMIILNKDSLTLIAQILGILK